MIARTTVTALVMHHKIFVRKAGHSQLVVQTLPQTSMHYVRHTIITLLVAQVRAWMLLIPVVYNITSLPLSLGASTPALRTIRAPTDTSGPLRGTMVSPFTSSSSIPLLSTHRVTTIATTATQCGVCCSEHSKHQISFGLSWFSPNPSLNSIKICVVLFLQH